MSILKALRRSSRRNSLGEIGLEGKINSDHLKSFSSSWMQFAARHLTKRGEGRRSVKNLNGGYAIEPVILLILKKDI